MQPAVTTCAACQNALTGNYYAAGEHVFCPPCRDQIIAAMTGGSAARRFTRAVVFGVLAGLAGALLWYAVGALTGWTIGLIAIVVGFAVGAAVRKGSDDRGGVAYQILAVVITYCSIALTFVPVMYSILKATNPDWPTALLVIATVIESVIAPIRNHSIIGILIIGFALWQAWQITRYRKIELQGPFTIAGAGATATTGPGAEGPGLAVLPPARWPNTSPTPPPPSNTPPPPPPQLGMS
jgi:hypothetical protein